VNFMMLPLCTRVTVLRLFLIANSIAMRTRRFDPNSDIGLMPTPESGRTRLPSSFSRNSISFAACGVPLANSMPA